MNKRIHEMLEVCLKNLKKKKEEKEREHQKNEEEEEEEEENGKYEARIIKMKRRK